MDRSTFGDEPAGEAHEPDQHEAAGADAGTADGAPTWAVEGSDPAGPGAGSDPDPTSRERSEASSEASECVAFGRALNAARAGQAAVLDAAVDLVLEVRERVLQKKQLVGVELGRTAARSVLADVKRCAVTEVQLKAGYGVTEARTLVALALAPDRLREVITGSMRRGESAWTQARHLWETSSQLTDDQRFLVATSLFGLDEGLAVPERLDLGGRLLAGVPWSHDSFTAACDREVAACEGIDVIAERERRRRAYAARAASLRLNDDGSGTLSVRGPLASLAAVYQRIDKGARNARALGDERTLANLRCDLITALLLYGTVTITAASGSNPAGGQESDHPVDAPLPRDHEAGCAGAGAPDCEDGHEDQSEGRVDPRPERGDLSPKRDDPSAECDCDPGSGLDEVLAPDDLDHLVRVINALPPVALQVVVPLDVLTPVIKRCPTCGEADEAKVRKDGDSVEGTPDTRRPAPRESSAPEPARSTDDPEEDSVPEWMRVLATWLPAGAGRGLVAEALGPKPFFLTPGLARELALTPGATIHRLVTDPVDGRCVERTRAGYRPDTNMRRQIQAADVYSRRPGSRTHFAACELDHVTPWGWAGGPTSEPNLATLELPTHRSKTDGYLDLTINHRRDLTFTTLLGQVVRTRVHDYGQYLRSAAPDDLATRRDLANRAVYAAYAADPSRGEAPTGLTRPHDHESWITLTHTALGRRRPGPAPEHPTVSELLHLPVDDDVA